MPLKVENKRFIDRSIFRFLENSWSYGHAKAEVLKYANSDYAINYCIKYVSKQITNSNSNQGYAPPIKQLQTIWKLRGKRLTYYGNSIRVLSWSRKYQYLYLQAQIQRLVLRKNTTHSQTINDYHPRKVTKESSKVVLTTADQKLLLKYSPKDIKDNGRCHLVNDY